MAELERKIIVSNSEMRPCVVSTTEGGKKAFFHRWSEHSEVIGPSLLRGGHSGGTVRFTVAIVEYEDGTVENISPEAIRFTDKAERDNEKAEFACRVCFEKLKRDNPQAIDCAWRGLDNEYCPELKKILEREDTKK